MRRLLPLILLWSMLALPLAAQTPAEVLPTGLMDLEASLLELKAQVVTLGSYSPEEYPDFKELEKTNQLVELLEYNKRKFDLLIKQYNLVEDKIFPRLLALSKENPGLRGRLLEKAREFSGKEEKSILLIQDQINRVALQIERLEKRLERLQFSLKKKEIAEEKKSKSDKLSKDTGISTQIDELEEERSNYRREIGEEKEKLEKLKEDEKKRHDKIEEKKGEIVELSAKANQDKNPVSQFINRTFAQVREVRINGLEIPQLNTTKTFIYLAETTLETLEAKAANLGAEIISLQKRRKQELINRLIKGLVIIVVAIFFVMVLNGLARRISRKVIAKIEDSEKVDDHRKQRYQTLSTVTLSFVKILSWALGALWVLGELDIDYAPFLVAAGGISLAIGFGAQSLVKDVVTGFFILMEEQFAIGDVVDIDGKTGTIESISLRTVKFRSLDGTLHIFPNGSISRVSNSTHLWSKAVVKVGASYDADARAVISCLEEICQAISEDPEWQEKLIDKPTAQGIISLGDSAVVYRVIAKTEPGAQWAVERELQVRIKEVFEAKGIEIPYNFVNIVDRSPKKD